MFSILVVEDDKNLRKLMLAVLKQNGYIGLGAENGEEALEIMDTSHVDLIISDIMMPYMDGYELADILREANYHLPILMVTAKESFEDKKKGFLIGIDDYMVKPVDMDEMILRVSALLRRSHIINKHLITIKDVVLDYNELTVTKNKESILLPKKEFYLLFKLLNYPKRIFTRQELMDEIWGMDAETDERTVDVHIKRLREKFFHFKEFEIITVRGLGYKAEKYDDKT
ncbi:MAG: two component transcriptional regulator, winged helix family [Clostridia bacterium]|jgi:DNA-binding response OmpR family regulator|nr:two component transcriptional regulator, winged helix family [Clostridia bacterium]